MINQKNIQANSQIQFLQIVCVVLVMATLICLVAAFFLYREVQNLEYSMAEAKKKVDVLENQRVGIVNDLQALKQIAGYKLTEVGDVDAVDGETIVGRVRKDIRELAGTMPEPTMRDALFLMHSRWKDIVQERNSLKDKLKRAGVP